MYDFGNEMFIWVIGQIKAKRIRNKGSDRIVGIGTLKLGFPLAGLKFDTSDCRMGIAATGNGAAMLVTVFADRARVAGAIVIFETELGSLFVSPISLGAWQKKRRISHKTLTGSLTLRIIRGCTGWGVEKIQESLFVPCTPNVEIVMVSGGMGPKVFIVID